MRHFLLLAIAWFSFSVGLLAQETKVGAFILVSQGGRLVIWDQMVFPRKQYLWVSQFHSLTP